MCASGCRTPLQFEDMWKLPPQDEVAGLSQRFERAWHKELQKPKPSLVRRARLRLHMQAPACTSRLASCTAAHCLLHACCGCPALPRSIIPLQSVWVLASGVCMLVVRTQCSCVQAGKSAYERGCICLPAARCLNRCWLYGRRPGACLWARCPSSWSMMQPPSWALSS